MNQFRINHRIENQSINHVYCTYYVKRRPNLKGDGLQLYTANMRVSCRPDFLPIGLECKTGVKLRGQKHQEVRIVYTFSRNSGLRSTLSRHRRAFLRRTSVLIKLSNALTRASCKLFVIHFRTTGVITSNTIYIIYFPYAK